jgi:membrane protease YdiL (CAAX protease family)
LFIFLILGTIIGSLITAVLIGIIPMQYSILLSYPMMFLPAMIYSSTKSRYNEGFEDGYAVDSNNFGKHKGYTMVFVAMAMTIAAAFVIEPVSMLLPSMPQWMIDQMNALMNGPAWVTVISVSIFAPFFEEWLCRGMVLRGMLKKVGPTWAIIISALFFALIHGNPWQAVPAFLMGIVFGYVYYKTGSLKLTMLMHFTNNTMAFIISQIPATANMEYVKDMVSPWAYGISYFLAAVIIVFGFILLKGIPHKEGDLGGCRKIPGMF